MASVTTHDPPARLTLFGFEPTPAEVRIVYRPRSWRVTRALLSIGIAVGVAPVVALVPPHAPWPILALGTGLYLAAKRWTERYTLRALTGRCPKCGHELSVGSPTRLKMPYSLACDGCRHELVLEVDPAGAGPDGAT